MSSPSENPPCKTKTVASAVDIIEEIKKIGGARITDISENIGMSKSTVYRHLQTLVNKGYVVENDSTYDLSTRFYVLGEYSINRREEFQLIAPAVKKLASESSERAQFLIEEHNRAVFLHTEATEHAVELDSHIGKQVPLYATAAGKAMLAHKSQCKTDSLVDSIGIKPITNNTITDMDEIAKELNEIRERGYAFNDQERVDGVRAVAVPVKQPNDQVLGALSIAGPTHRMKGKRFREEIPDLLLGTANELELEIEYS